MTARSLCAAAVALALSVSGIGQASAEKVLNVKMTFASGASFDGKVKFADDYSYVTDVTGLLKGYGNEFQTPDPTASTTINWVWDNGVNFASGASTYGTFLMNGAGSGYTGSDYSNWVDFTYDYSNPGKLTFSDAGFGNAASSIDQMISGSISAAGVPEPATWALMILGFGAVGGTMRRRRSATAKLRLA
jgi:hypothetical protein